MKNLFLFIMLLMLAGGCGQKPAAIAEADPVYADQIFHYSVLKALDNGVLESTMTIGELKNHGGHGLGTYNGLDGEMIAMDDVIYRVQTDGRVYVPEDRTQTPYAVVCHYNEDHTLHMEGDIDYPSMWKKGCHH